MAAEMAALRSYVMQDGSQSKAESTVLLHVTHSNLKQRFTELRFDLQSPVAAVKDKLRTHTGTSAASMRLWLLNARGEPDPHPMADDNRPLGYYSPRDGDTLHVEDMDPNSVSANRQLEDLTLVEKYRISEDAYDARADSFRKYKQEKLAQDPTWTLEREMAERRGQPYVPKEPAAKVTDPEYMADIAGNIQVGQRCEVDPGAKRGGVRFVGKVDSLAPGYWIGIAYDEPVGKNDGSVKGVRLFECQPGYGSVVRPDKVKVGNYPPIDEFADEDEI
eukprot:jgi/Chlat1/7879/Chrsp66S07311